MHHVKAHSGHPWNEAADSLAWAVVHGWIGTWSIDDTLNPLTLNGQFPHMLEWVWFFSYVEQKMSQCLDADLQTLTLDLEAPFHQAPSAITAVHDSSQDPEVAKDRCSGQLSFRCATANVLTLFPGIKGAAGFISARQEALMRMMRDHHILVCGIQESRSKTDGHLDGGDFHILSSPATQAGQYGIQLWVAKSWPMHPRALQVQHTHLHIVHNTSRRMTVLLSHPLIRLLFVVGHVPSSDDPHLLRQWWNATSNAIPTKYRDIPLIGLFDANSRVGSQPSRCIQQLDAEEETIGGACFHEWLEHERLFLPQSDSRWHSGPSATWVHSSGQASRIDYVVLSQELSDMCQQTCRAQVDLSLGHMDHFCVQCDLLLQVDVRPAKAFKERNHTELVSDEQISQIPWHLSVHSHADQVHNWLHNFQPARQKAVRWKPHLTDDTWNLIQEKKLYWQKCCDAFRTKKKGLLAAIMQAWNELCHTG